MAAKYNEYDVVRLTASLSPDLPQGSEGAILLVYDDPGLPIAYEVEFLDSQGDTIALLTVEERYLEQV